MSILASPCSLLRFSDLAHRSLPSDLLLHCLLLGQVEFISEEECAFLYDEIFVRQEYFKHGNRALDSWGGFMLLFLLLFL